MPSAASVTNAAAEATQPPVIQDSSAPILRRRNKVPTRPTRIMPVNDPPCSAPLSFAVWPGVMPKIVPANGSISSSSPP